MLKERIEELDVFRGMAFLSIVLQHAIGAFVYKKGIQPEDFYTLGILYHFSKFGVPAFVFITGITLFYNHYNQLNYLRFIKKRFVHILVPYFFWTVIFYVYTYSNDPINMTWIGNIGKQLLFPTIGYHLWFILMIFQYYLLHPLLLHVFKWGREWVGLSKTKLLMVIGLSGIVYLWFLWFSDFYSQTHDATHSGFIGEMMRDRNSLFLSYSFYFLLGAVVAATIPAWRRWVLNVFALNIFLFVFFYTLLGYEFFKGSAILMSLDWSSTLKPSMFFLVLSEIIFLYGLSLQMKEVSQWVFKILRFTGKYSFGAYLVHALVLNVYMRWFNMLFFLNRHYSYFVATFVTFFIVSIISVIITVCVNQIPFGNYLIGFTKKRKKLQVSLR